MSSNIRHGIVATTNPGVNDDSTKDIQVGTPWLNTATRQLYECHVNTATAAVWKRQVPEGVTSKAAPTTSNPSTSSSTFAQMPEMSVTETINSGRALVIAHADIDLDDGEGFELEVEVDSTRLDEIVEGEHGVAEESLSVIIPGTFVGIATGLTVASHTFKSNWRSSSGGTILNVGIQRSLKVMEL